MVMLKYGHIWSYLVGMKYDGQKERGREKKPDFVVVGCVQAGDLGRDRPNMVKYEGVPKYVQISIFGHISTNLEPCEIIRLLQQYTHVEVQGIQL